MIQPLPSLELERDLLAAPPPPGPHKPRRLLRNLLIAGGVWKVLVLVVVLGGGLDLLRAGLSPDLGDRIPAAAAPHPFPYPAD